MEYLQGADERPLAPERARSEMFRGLMADRALEARADRRPPVEMPTLPLPLAWAGPSRATAHAANDGIRAAPGA